MDLDLWRQVSKDLQGEGEGKWRGMNKNCTRMQIFYSHSEFDVGGSRLLPKALANIITMEVGAYVDKK